jgi:hypothetical protein
MALSGHSEMHAACPLSGAKQTSSSRAVTSAFDPKATSNAVSRYSSSQGLSPNPIAKPILAYLFYQRFSSGL